MCASAIQNTGAQYRFVSPFINYVKEKPVHWYIRQTQTSKKQMENMTTLRLHFCSEPVPFTPRPQM